MSPVGSETIRVLHVEDDPEVAELTATFLEREDDRLAVESVSTAAAALDRLADGTVDCLVTDYHLPNARPSTFVTEVRDTSPGLPVVFYSGRHREDVASDLLADDATGYVQKGSGTEQYTTLATTVVSHAASEEPLPDGGLPDGEGTRPSGHGSPGA